MVALSILLWSVPNNEGSEWEDRAWDFCMATAGDDDWKCDELLSAPNE